MVNKEQFINGILSYVDNEVIPVLPTAGKWGLGTVILLSSTQYNDIYENLVTNSLIRTLGIVNESGLIDTDRLTDALKKCSNKYGKLVITIPIIGTLTFTTSDIVKMEQYMHSGGVKNDRGN